MSFSLHHIDKSAVMTVIGVILLFSTAIAVTLIAPRYVDSSWTTPTSPYQVQMYEVSDPHLFIGRYMSGGTEIQSVYELIENFSLLAFRESETMRIVAPPHLEKYITRSNDPILKLTSHLMLLRPPEAVLGNGFDAVKEAKQLRNQLLEQWEKDHPQSKEAPKPDFEIYELYEPGRNRVFAVAATDGILENWVDKDFVILDDKVQQPYHQDPGVIYVNDPREYRLSHYVFGDMEGWRYDPGGKSVESLEELQSYGLGFRSRQELIQTGEHIFAIEGCWYCHTDQTRTLVQDVVLNGSDSFPAPPSAANEYIYQRITFPGTRRIGPDISRVGIKRPSRDWHKSHFWSPQTASKGSIMPSFRHFFDYDPRGTAKNVIGIPNYQFEAVFQYLMTKGTRITPPTQAWWNGRDPIQTKEIIEGQRTLP
jgi:cytochrome c oxidase cbb3-type subunit 2